MLCLLLFTLAVAASARQIPSPLESIQSLNAELDKVQLQEPVKLRINEHNMEDVTVRTGDSIELRCEAVAIPPPTFTWTFNGKPIVLDGGNNIYEKLRNIGKVTIENAITSSRLVIPCAEKKHRGVYACSAGNGHKSETKSAKVTVVGKSSKKCAAAVSEVAPRIVQWSDSRFENIGNAVQLFCRHTGGQVVWYDEERQKLNDQPGYEVFPNGDLLILSSSWSHMGTYTCVVSNEFGEDRRESFFYPTKPSASKP